MPFYLQKYAYLGFRPQNAVLLCLKLYLFVPPPIKQNLLGKQA